MPYCTTCSTFIDKKNWIGHLRSNTHRDKIYSQNLEEGVVTIASAFRSRIVSYKVSATTDNEQRSLDNFFDANHNKIKKLLDDALQKHVCVKVNFEHFASFLMFKNDTTEIKCFGTKNVVLHMNYDFDAIYIRIVNSIKKKIESFQERDSGWTFLNNSHVEINVNKYQPLRGSSFIELPKFIKNKKACLNIKNNDPYCFLWSITAALFPSKTHPDRVTSYPYCCSVFNVKGMSFPVGFSDIATFEKNNPDIAIFVYGLKGGKTITGPLYRSVSKVAQKTVHLLLLENGSSSHYCLIKSLPRLVRSQITKHHHQLHLCERCLLFFKSPEEVEGHLCGQIATVLPKKGSFLEFKNYSRKQNMPFIIYADFETMLECYEGCEGDPNLAYTSTKRRHIPVAFAYYIVCTLDSKYNKFVTYRGADCVEKIVSWLYRDAKKK